LIEIETAATAALEQAVNGALSLDPGAKHVLAPLNGCVLKLSISSPTMTLFAIFSGAEINLYQQYAGDVHLELSGTAAEFAAMARNPKSNALIDSGVKAHGQTGVLIKLNEALPKLDLDPEGKLAEWVGPIAAHQIGSGARKLWSGLKQAKSSFDRLASESIHYEARLAPTSDELAQFSADVRDVQRRFERLEARFNQWKSR
jgi:ubiquinone biosynthesis protein UbiJ